MSDFHAGWALVDMVKPYNRQKQKGLLAEGCEEGEMSKELSKWYRRRALWLSKLWLRKDWQTCECESCDYNRTILNYLEGVIATLENS